MSMTSSYAYDCVAVRTLIHLVVSRRACQVQLILTIGYTSCIHRIISPEKETAMRGTLPTRFWIESAPGAASTALLIVTLVWHNWIELAFGVDPDASSGALEWIIVGLALAITVGSIH